LMKLKYYINSYLQKYEILLLNVYKFKINFNDDLKFFIVFNKCV
jgi:hypothetical protein